LTEGEGVRVEAGQHRAELLQRPQARVGARHVAEHVLAEIKMSRRRARPRDPIIIQPGLEQGFPKLAAFEHAIGAIDVPSDPLADVRPVFLQSLDDEPIDRHAGRFHPGDGDHVAAPQQRAADIQRRQHRHQELPQGIERRRRRAPVYRDCRRRTEPDAGAHQPRAHRPMMSVGGNAELDHEVDYPLRQRPAQREVAADQGVGLYRHEQCRRSRRVGRPASP
jgi:hypothetical protein